MRKARGRWIAWCSLVICAGLYPVGLSRAQSTPTPTPQPSAAADKANKPRAPRTKKVQAPVASNAAPAPTTPTTPAPTATAANKPAQAEKPVLAAANVKPAPPPPPAAPAAPPKPACTLAEAEQPRGGRLEVLSDAFGAAPVVRIAGKPARMIERRPDRVSVQVPADSDGGPITLLHDGKTSGCGNLVIIGKNR